MRSFWRFLGSFFSLMFSIFVEALLLIHMKDRLPSFFHIPRFAPPGGIQSAAYMSSRFVVSPCFAHGNWCRNSVTLNRWQGFTRVYVQSGEVLFSRLSKPGPPPENFHTSVLLFSCQGQMSAQSKLRRCCEKHLPYAEKLPVVWTIFVVSWLRPPGFERKICSIAFLPAQNEIKKFDSHGIQHYVAERWHPPFPTWP